VLSQSNVSFVLKILPFVDPDDQQALLWSCIPDVNWLIVVVVAVEMSVGDLLLPRSWIVLWRISRPFNYYYLSK